MKSSGFEKPAASNPEPKYDVWSKEAILPEYDYSVESASAGPEAKILSEKYGDLHNRNYRPIDSTNYSPDYQPVEYRPPDGPYIGRNFTTPGPNRDNRQQKRSFRHRLSDWLGKFGL